MKKGITFTLLLTMLVFTGCRDLTDWKERYDRMRDTHRQLERQYNELKRNYELAEARIREYVLLAKEHEELQVRYAELQARVKHLESELMYRAEDIDNERKAWERIYTE